MVESIAKSGDERFSVERSRPVKITDGQEGELKRLYLVHRDPINRTWSTEPTFFKGVVKFHFSLGIFDRAEFISEGYSSVNLAATKKGSDVFGYTHQVMKTNTDPGSEPHRSPFISTETLDITLF